MTVLQPYNVPGPLRFIIAGGGTGGHIFPAIAIANAIKAKRPNAEFLFVGAKGKMEMEKVPAAGYPIKGLDIAGYNRSSMLKNIFLPFKVVKSFFDVSGILSAYKPDAVIGVGGYSSYPVLRAAQAKGIKTFIHESNSFAGKSNILLGKKATKVFTAWPAMERFFSPEKTVQTGNPIRQSILNQNISRAEALRSFGLDENKKTVLSIGGSLGAQSINECLAENIDVFGRHGLQLIWQTGKPFIEEAKKACAGKSNVYVTDFINKMEYAFSAADIVISRSGAMASAELCAVGKPVVFVPYPFAAEDHQTANAKALTEKDAAWMVPNDQVRTALVPAVLALAGDPATCGLLAKNILTAGIKDADEAIARNILEEMEKN